MIQSIITPTGEPVQDSSYPWWIKALSTFGVPAALLIFIIYYFVGVWSTQIDNIEEMVKAHQTDTAYNVQSNVNQQQQLSNIFFMLQRVCVRLSKDSNEREDCFGAK